MKASEYIRTSELAAVASLLNSEGRILPSLVKSHLKKIDEEAKILKKFLKFRAKIPKSIESGKKVEYEGQTYVVAGFSPKLVGDKISWAFVELEGLRGEKIEVELKKLLKGKK
jgi:hypothetical protein